MGKLLGPGESSFGPKFKGRLETDMRWGYSNVFHPFPERLRHLQGTGNCTTRTSKVSFARWARGNFPHLLLEQGLENPGLHLGGQRGQARTGRLHSQSPGNFLYLLDSSRGAPIFAEQDLDLNHRASDFRPTILAGRVLPPLPLLHWQRNGQSPRADRPARVCRNIPHLERLGGTR